MLVCDILCETKQSVIVQLIRQCCSDFLVESQYQPVYKILPSSYGNWKRVKVRKQKKQTEITSTFNKAFESIYDDIALRSVCSDTNIVDIPDDHSAYYIFPLNGFKYLYNTTVTKYTQNLRETVGVLNDGCDDELVLDVLAYSYKNTQLTTGIRNNAEIIFYNIPAYYAVNTTSISNYSIFKG